MGKLVEVVADAAQFDVQAGEIRPTVHSGRAGERRLAQIHGGTHPGRAGARLERGALGGGERDRELTLALLAGRQRGTATAAVAGRTSGG